MAYVSRGQLRRCRSRHDSSGNSGVTSSVVVVVVVVVVAVAVLVVQV